jgi:hypothetical protein
MVQFCGPAKAMLRTLVPLLLAAAQQQVSEESLAAAPAATAPAPAGERVATRQVTPLELWQAALGDLKVMQVRTVNTIAVLLRSLARNDLARTDLAEGLDSKAVAIIFYLFR